jgi:hypothetical protein
VYRPPAVSRPIPSASAPATRRRNRLRGPRGFLEGGVVVIVGVVQP